MGRSPRVVRSLGLAVLALHASSAGSTGAEEPIDAAPPNPAQILQQAFTNQYEIDSTARIDLVIRSAAGQERTRRLDAAAKIIEGRMHSIGRLTYPEHLRGMTILQIEVDDHAHNAFIYLPSMQSVRRVTTAQRGDSFFGTDVTYEDLERRYARDFEVVDFAQDEIEGEPALAIRARPRTRQTYHEARFWVAASDNALLQIHYYKRNANEPYRTISAPRASMRQLAGHTLPTRLLVESRSRRTTTEVTYHDLQVNPEIDDRLFSIRTLEQKGKIPVGK
jgi:hypothetical protein